jgi:DnaK suppressor protein
MLIDEKSKPMNQEQREQLRLGIFAEVKNLKKTVAQLEDSSKPVPPDNAYGRLSRMEAINSKSISEAGLRSARSRLSRLENALQRLDEEDFGICLQCEEPIPIGRILLVPESTLCVGCADQR